MLGEEVLEVRVPVAEQVLQVRLYGLLPKYCGKAPVENLELSVADIELLSDPALKITSALKKI